MASSRASLIRRHFRQRFGISAPKVGIRREINLYWRLLIWFLVMAALIALGYFIFDAGRRFYGAKSGLCDCDTKGFQETIERLTVEKSQSQELARATDGRLQVELATIDQMKSKLLLAQRETAALKGDLALFEALIASPAESTEVLKIARVRIEPAAVQGRYRFSVLFVRQLKDKKAMDSTGELQFSLNIKRPEGDVIITVPGDGNPPSSQFRINVRHFHRAEGEFALPIDGVLLGGEVRFVQNGIVRVRHPIVQ